MSDKEVSIQIAAVSPEDARALFEKCMTIVNRDRLYPEGTMVPPAADGGGCAMVYTFNDEDLGSC